MTERQITKCRISKRRKLPKIENPWENAHFIKSANLDLIVVLVLLYFFLQLPCKVLRHYYRKSQVKLGWIILG
jgi:hypothetical protein